MPDPVGAILVVLRLADRARVSHERRRRLSSVWSRAALVALVSVAGGFLAASPARAITCPPPFSDAGGGWCSADFVYTGAPEIVTLPASGWYAVRVDAYGAQGGDSREDGIGQASSGGLGGRQVATVVRPGGTALTLIVGQVGSMQQGGLPIVGGYGGGGQPPSVYGGGGGGGSFVFDDAGPIVIAGGGGGGGWDANPTWSGGLFSTDQQAPGGAGAGAVGPGGDGQSVAFCCDPTPGVVHYAPGGGHGATALAPGAGGVPGTPPSYLFGQTPGDPGQGPATSALALGNGGNGGGTSGGSGCLGTWSGGGGGGYNGGGGGGDIPCDLEGGGGGGGIGYVDLNATATLSQTGVQLADGMITLGYSVTTAPAWPVVTANPVDQSVVAGQPFSFSASASGTPAPTVRWQVSSDGGASFSDIAGAGTTTYGGTASLADDGNLFRAVFTNTSGAATSAAASLTVSPAPPTVTSVSPSSGTTAGGTSVTITGTNLSGVLAVSFGDTAAATFGNVDDTHVTATSPAHVAGVVHVTVTTSAGTSPTSPDDQYTYHAPMTCGMGAGLPNGTRPPRNTGTVKVMPGARSTPSSKNTTIKLTGTLENCAGFDGVASKYPITAGSIVAVVKVPAGASCSELVSGLPLASRLRVVWKGINPKTGKLSTAAASDTGSLAAFSQAASPLAMDGASAPLAGKKSLFVGHALVFEAIIDESPSDIAALCAAKGGLKALHFTGVNGPSLLSVE